jgi:hypothetical protein
LPPPPDVLAWLSVFPRSDSEPDIAFVDIARQMKTIPYARRFLRSA